MDFSIDPEFQSYMQAPRPEERSGLKALIEDGGHVDPGVVAVWEEDDNTIVVLGDGHTRREICTELGIEFPVRYKQFISRQHALQWVIDNQLGRRNLTDERRAYLIGKKYLEAKKPVGNPQFRQSDGIGAPTSESVANDVGVSPRTVERDAVYSQAVDRIGEQEGPEAKAAILNGQSGMTKQEVIEKANPPEEEPELHRRIREYLIANPSASAKAVHRALGCSEHTVAKVKAKLGTVGDAAEGEDAKDKPERPDTTQRRPASTNGKPTFDDRAVLEALRKASVILNNRAQALGQQRSNGWRLVREKMDTLLNAWEEWQKEVS